MNSDGSKFNCPDEMTNENHIYIGALENQQNVDVLTMANVQNCILPQRVENTVKILICCVMMDVKKNDGGSYNSTSLSSFASYLHSKEKKNVIHQGRSVLEETVPSVFSAASSLRPRAVLNTSRLVNKTYISLFFSLLRVHKTINRIDLLQRGIINANGSYIFKVIAQDHGFPRLSSEISVEINIVEAGDDSPVFNR